MAKTPNLTVNKNGYYSIRFRVHSSLVPHFKRQAINKSLKTVNYNEAKVKADTIYFQYKKLLEVLPLLTTQQIEEIVKNYIETTLEEDKNNRASFGFGLVYAGEGGHDTPFEDSATASNDVLAEFLYDYKKGLANSDYSVVEEEGKTLLELLKIEYDSSDTSHQLFLQRFLRAKIEVYEESCSRNRGVFSDKYDYVETFTKRSVSNSLTMMEAFSKYEKWYNSADITIKQYNATINKLERTIIPYFGASAYIEEISTENIDEFREYLEEFPNISRVPYKHMSYQELCEITYIPEDERISIDTQCKYLKIVKQFFKYLCDANLLSYNPCNLLRMPDAQNDKTEPFTCKDIENLFKEFESLDDKKYIYYTLAYTGMRPNEFWKSSINQEEGIYYFDLTGSHLNLKTLQSKRKIPIHKKLLELDIVNRFEKLQSTYKQEKISNYFNKTIKPKYIPEEENKRMYSFRHTVATNLKRAEVHMDKVSEILGHSYESKTITKMTYASPYSLKQLKEAIDKLQY